MTKYLHLSQEIPWRFIGWSNRYLFYKKFPLDITDSTDIFDVVTTEYKRRKNVI